MPKPRPRRPALGQVLLEPGMREAGEKQSSREPGGERGAQWWGGGESASKPGQEDAGKELCS